MVILNHIYEILIWRFMDASVSNMGYLAMWEFRNQSHTFSHMEHPTYAVPNLSQ